MGIVSRFERTLQGAVGDAFARLFGGKVVAAEVEAQLRRQAEASLRTIDGHQLVSNSYTITLARTDYETFTEDEQLAIRTFSRHLTDHIADQGWETYGPVTVGFAAREDLHTGQFRVAGTVDPDAVPFHVSSAAPAPQPGHSVPASPRGSNPSDSPSHWPPVVQSAPAPPGAPVSAAVRIDPVPAAPATAYPAQAYPVREAPSGAGWGGPSEARTQVTRGRTTRTVTLYLEDGSGRTFRLQHGSNLIGRGQGAAFRLPDTGVSREHADIHFDGSEAMLSDLGSTNGTTVNDGPVQDWQLADGDVIRVGHSEIVVRFD